jgi:hypothetical protein
VTTIGFLHTADAHVATFRALREELAPGWEDVHVSDPGLLAAARAHGDFTQALAARLHELADAGADVIVCTCSTLGGHAEALTADMGVPVLRGDRPMADAAVAAGARIAVVATVESTLGPTADLLREAAARAGREVTLVETLCPAAFPLFEAGDHDGYAREVAARAREAAAAADVVVLAQPSMAPAAALLAGLPVLTSPRSAVAAAIAAGELI